MNLPLATSSKFEVRVVIRYHTAKGKDASAIHWRIVEKYGNIMSVEMVRRWRCQFLEGRTDIGDELWSGRLSENTEDTVNAVHRLIEEDGWRTTREIECYLAEEALTPISHPTICKILHDELGLSKVCVSWVPKLLTDEHKQNCMATAIKFLSPYHAEGESLFDHIVTGDEKYVHHFTPETKQASTVWKSTDKPTPIKAKRERSVGKVLLTMFWNSQCVLLEENAAPKQTVMKDTYFDTLIPLRQAIKNKRMRKLSRKILFIHDNAKLQAAKIVQALLEDSNGTFFAIQPIHPTLSHQIIICSFVSILIWAVNVSVWTPRSRKLSTSSSKSWTLLSTLLVSQNSCTITTMPQSLDFLRREIGFPM